MGFPTEYKRKLFAALDSIDLAKVDEAVAAFRRAREDGRQIFVCGNGGSAATASHFACDIVKGASYDREQRFRIMALSESVSTLTAYANDLSYDAVFVEQLKNFANRNDILMAISASGNSPNVLCAVEYARSLGAYTIGLSGRDGGKLRPLVDLSLHVDDGHVGRIEDAHMVICHMIGYHFMDLEGPD